MSNGNNGMPPECDGVDPCKDPACQQAIAGNHVISEQEFQSRINTQAGDPKRITAADIQNLVDSGKCGQDMIVLNQNAASNAQLDPQIADAAGGMVAYSLPCFKGILTQSPDYFGFCLASGTSGNDVIFKVSYGGARPDMYYDASGLWP